MAAPHVAAALAVLRQEFPSDSVRQLEQKLLADAPTLLDARTGTKVPGLELSHTAAASNATPSAAAAASASGGQSSTTPAESPKSGSFIVKSGQSADTIKGTLDSVCNGAMCDLKSVGSDTYRLEITPKENALSGKQPSFTADDLKRALGGAPNVQIFENKIFAPLKF
jgi:hypothetical protein